VLEIVGPHPGRVDHLARLDVALLVGEVVDLGVPVLQGADQRIGLQRRGDLQRLALGQVAVAAHALVAAQLVVEQHPGADVDALPDPAGEGQEERHRAHEMRRDHVQQQAALAQRLVDEAEFHLLEVAQAAMDQLCWSGSMCRRRSRAPPAARPRGRGWRRRGRNQCPSRRRR
jgi:hypothetical protein